MIFLSIYIEPNIVGEEEKGKERGVCFVWVGAIPQMLGTVSNRPRKKGATVGSKRYHVGM